MKIEVVEITDRLGFEILIQSRSVETHSRMQQLKPHEVENIKAHLLGALRSVAHYIDLNTKKTA